MFDRAVNIFQVLNMPGFWIDKSYEYATVLNMEGLLKILNVREYP